MHFHIPTMLLMLVVAFWVMALGLAFLLQPTTGHCAWQPWAC